MLENEDQPMKHIDPLHYAHNIAALQLLEEPLPPGVHAFSKEIDKKIIKQWCTLNDSPLSYDTFISQEAFAEQNRFDAV